MKERKFYKYVFIIFMILASIYSYNNYLRPIKINNKINRDSEHYINDLYQSDAYYYNKLNKQEKMFYDDIVKYVKEGKRKAKINLTKYGCKKLVGCSVNIHDIYFFVTMDHPELIELTYLRYENENNSSIIEIEINNLSRFNFINKLHIKKMQRIVEDIRKATENMTDIEKIEYVYNWIGDNTKYDFAFTYSSKNQSAYNSLVKGGGVCASFAKTSQIIFQNIGIESWVVMSYDHMWNVIKLNDKYYFFDSTVASAIRKDGLGYYNGLNSSYLQGNKLKHPDFFPKISTDEYYKK